MAQQRAQIHVESLRLLSGGWLHPILANHDVSASKRLIREACLCSMALCTCHRFAWAYQQLVDTRYEWAVKGDQRVNQPANSPVSDALFILDGNSQANASTGPPSSLQYYLAVLEQNAIYSTDKKQLGSAPLPTYLLRGLPPASVCTG